MNNKSRNLFYTILVSLIISNLAFANSRDGVRVLPDNPTESQIQLVRDGAKDYCTQDDDNEREQCVADYYVQHNLDEEPSCD